jgi:hypothetical protein
MGAHPYWYVVPYQPDPDAALHELRRREFEAGRYNPVMPFIPFPVGPDSPAPGPEHDTIADALADAGPDGTRSILDIHAIGDAPDFCTAGPLPDDELRRLFGTATPTREQVETAEGQDGGFTEDLERGHAVYIVLYKDGTPDEILFAGYSFD